MYGGVGGGSCEAPPYPDSPNSVVFFIIPGIDNGQIARMKVIFIPCHYDEIMSIGCSGNQAVY